MESDARKFARTRTDRTWDILLIDDRMGPQRKMQIEECGGTTVITANSERAALRVLQTIAVDAIYNFPSTGEPKDAERFRSFVAERYPSVRVTDPWTQLPQPQGNTSRHALPFYLQLGFDCDTRRRMSQARSQGPAARLNPDPPLLPFNDEHAA